jgi:hypothetical protein
VIGVDPWSLVDPSLLADPEFLEALDPFTWLAALIGWLR